MSISSCSYPFKPQVYVRLAQVFSAKLVLEVFGGGGAIWGASEIVTFRNPQTVHFWRPCAAIFAAVFLARFSLQIKDFLRNEYMSLNNHNNINIKEEECHVFRFVQIFSAKFVLEVCGGGGALWGSMEALGLRNPQTQHFWRIWSSAFLLLFFARFLSQSRDYFHKRIASTATADDDMMPSMNVTSYQLKIKKRCAQIFSAKFVLEVLGGAGAIWGFSEVIGLRTPETLWFWRPCALMFGAVFFFRWWLQMSDFLSENMMMESPVYPKELSRVEERKELIDSKSPKYEYV